jgi:hypothetical protein
MEIAPFKKFFFFVGASYDTSRRMSNRKFAEAAAVAEEAFAC